MRTQEFYSIVEATHTYVKVAPRVLQGGQYSNTGWRLGLRETAIGKFMSTTTSFLWQVTRTSAPAKALEDLQRLFEWFTTAKTYPDFLEFLRCHAAPQSAAGGRRGTHPTPLDAAAAHAAHDMQATRRRHSASPSCATAPAQEGAPGPSGAGRLRRPHTAGAYSRPRQPGPVSVTHLAQLLNQIEVAPGSTQPQPQPQPQPHQHAREHGHGQQTGNRIITARPWTATAQRRSHRVSTARPRTAGARTVSNEAHHQAQRPHTAHHVQRPHTAHARDRDRSTHMHTQTRRTGSANRVQSASPRNRSPNRRSPLRVKSAYAARSQASTRTRLRRRLSACLLAACCGCWAALCGVWHADGGVHVAHHPRSPRRVVLALCSCARLGTPSGCRQTKWT